VRFSTSFFHLSICTQGKVAAGGKLAYLSFMGSAEAGTGKIKVQANSVRTPINKHMVPANFRDTFLSIKHLLGDSHSTK
jgi:hypothetical protein